MPLPIETENKGVPRATFNISEEQHTFLEKIPKGVRSKIMGHVIDLLMEFTGDERIFGRLIDPLVSGQLELRLKGEKDDPRRAIIDDALRIE